MDADELKHITACREGRLEEFDPLYVRHVDAIYRYLLRRTLSKAIAEDLTSTTFVKALEAIRSFDPAQGELRPWLYRIARNSLFDYYRSLKHASVDIESVWDLASDEVASLATEQSIDAVAVHKALATLTSDQREIVLLRVWERMSYKEIADLTGKSEANAKMIFSRSLASLRTEMTLLLLLFFFPRTL